MHIAIGSDHGGFNLKNKIISYLESCGHKVKDYGTFSKESVDYSDFGLKVAESIKNNEADRGIVVCGTGIGISIAANKVSGIRSAVCTDSYMAKMSREHNDANILALGERVIGEGVALDIVNTWLESEFKDGRHKKRIDKIIEIEKKYNKSEA